MNTFAHLVLLGWIPACLVVFAVWGARFGVGFTLVAGPMLLPVLSLDLPGPLDLSKAEATSLALLLGVVIFDSARLASYRPRPLDLVLLAWVLAGATASVSNNLGGYDAFAVALTRTVKWGIPYWIGALYFANREGLRLALWSLFLAGLAYAPLCLFEVRMSPRLHGMVYGMAQHDFSQTMRGGGFRPMVFMAHGLELSLWMAAASVAGFALWRSRPATPPLRLPLGPALALVAATAVLCKSTGAILLGVLGVAATLPALRRFACHTLLAVVPLFIATRLFGSGVLERTLVGLSEAISGDRASSLQFRFDNEVILLEKLWQNPWFGAGGWTFGTIVDPESGELTLVTTDSYWIIMAATTGLFGLCASVGLLWLPATRGLRAGGATHPERLAACTVLAMLVLDSLVNAFVPPFYLALAGALAHAPLTTSEDAALAVPAAPGASAPLQPAREPRRTAVAAWLRPRRQPNV